MKIICNKNVYRIQVFSHKFGQMYVFMEGVVSTSLEESEKLIDPVYPGAFLLNQISLYK